MITISFVSVTNAEVFALEPLSFEIFVSFDPPGENCVQVNEHLDKILFFKFTEMSVYVAYY